MVQVDATAVLAYNDALAIGVLKGLRKLGVAVPEEVSVVGFDNIIFDELVRGEQRLESLFYFQQVIERLKSSGCDAVVLGCTELPLLVGNEESPLPVLDSTRILARAALRYALDQPQDAKGAK